MPANGRIVEEEPDLPGIIEQQRWQHEPHTRIPRIGLRPMWSVSAYMASPPVIVRKTLPSTAIPRQPRPSATRFQTADRRRRSPRGGAKRRRYL